MDINLIPPQTHVVIQTNNSEFQGILLPSESDIVVLKLSSGYNIGISKKHIIKVLTLDSKDSSSSLSLNNSVDSQDVKEKIIENSSLPTIKILHTGGTIASRVDYKTGAVVADFEPSALLNLFPELLDIANIQSEFLGNMFSDDFRFAHFNIIAKQIFESAKQGINKFILTCGTDFLHYASSALSYLLHEVPVGVLVVGSQRSSDRGSSDAAINIICAAQFLANQDFIGVGACMHEHTDDDSCLIFRGINLRKMHSSRRDAFKQINSYPLARVHFEKKEIILLSELPKKSFQDISSLPSSFKLPLFKEDLKIGLLYSHPQFWAQELEPYFSFDALVLAGSGLGHMPISVCDDTTSHHKEVKEKLFDLAKKIPVVMSTQTLYGRVHLNVYAPARELQENNIIGHNNSLTPETSFIKLAWLLSNYPKDQLPSLFTKDFVGENTSIRENEFY
jgi:glutamyl-tRNA(Gln) amidotransferase subunit D